MAKGTANCVCKICGAEFTRETIERNRKEADAWVKWAEATFDECPSCYGKRKAEEEKAKGLEFAIRLMWMEKEATCCFVTFGDTYPIKDELSKRGYRWNSRYPENSSPLSLLSMREPKKRWTKEIPLEKTSDLEAELEALEAMGFKGIEAPAAWEVAAYREEANRKAAEKEAKAAEIITKLGDKPEYPDSIRSKWPQGSTWNGKVYGRSGSYCVYFAPKGSRDGLKVLLTDEEAEAMNKIHDARAKWEADKTELMR